MKAISAVDLSLFRYQLLLASLVCNFCWSVLLVHFSIKTFVGQFRNNILLFSFVHNLLYEVRLFTFESLVIQFSKFK
jgi:hypothetical protein